MQGVGFRGSNCSEDFAWSSGLLFMRGVLNRGLGFRVGALKKGFLMDCHAGTSDVMPGLGKP